MSPTPQDRPIVLAAGGTGGHMFPAEALAHALLARGRSVVLVTDLRGRAFGDALPAVPVHRIHAAQLGGGLLGKARGALELALGTVQALALLKRLKPAAVVGFGGYPAVPTVFAAQRAGIPTLLHEQNAILGRANRLLAGGAAGLATSFPEVRGLKPGAPAHRVHTGNPVRPALLPVRGLPYPVPAPDGPVRLLVLGGSQGARVFSGIMPKALGLLPEPLRRRIALVQQCRPEDLEAARAAFAAAGIAADLSSFFRDVPDRLAACHLAVCRAGASTCAELTVAGRPAVLVPYPHAMDDHQTANAAALADAGAAWMIPQPAFTPEALAARLEALLAVPATLTAAAAAARAWGIPDAAERLADAVLEVAGSGAGGGAGTPITREAAE